MKTFSFVTNSPYLYQWKVYAKNLDEAIETLHTVLNFKKLAKHEHLPVEIWEGEKLRQSFTHKDLELITKIYK